MKFYCIVALSLVAVCAAETYTSENDDLDIAAVVADPKALQDFAGCFNDNKVCGEVPGDFKKDIPEAIRQACAKCTPAQKHIFRVFLEGLKAKLPAEYEAFKNKYDPENKHFPALLAAVANS